MSQPDIPLRAIDHVRFFVGNARQSAYFYRNAFGFDVIAYSGLETRTKHEAGYVLRQGNITFVLASPLSGSHPEAQRIIWHGDGVQDIAIEVDDVRAAYRLSVERGATGVCGPKALEDEHGVYEYATIRHLLRRRPTPSSTATATRAFSRRATSRSIPTAITRAPSSRPGC